MVPALSQLHFNGRLPVSMADTADMERGSFHLYMHESACNVRKINLNTHGSPKKERELPRVSDEAGTSGQSVGGS